MERFYKRTYKESSSSTTPIQQIINDEPKLKKVTLNRIEVNLENLPSDPSLRPKISDYDPNQQDEVRRAYLQTGPCQPDHKFPQKKIGNKNRRFKKEWFTKYKSWIEYSIKMDAAYCLPCYLFRSESGDLGSGEKYVVSGFSNWKNSKRLQNHVGNHNSFHNEACRKSKNLMNQNQHIETLLVKQSTKDRIDYRIRLNATLDVVRLLISQGLPFRGHDESSNSRNKGNFLEILRFLTNHNEEIKLVSLENAPKNLKLIAPEIQKDISKAAAIEVVNSIIKDLDGDIFAVLIDEARDTSIKEQMAVVIRYVDKKGNLIERFVGVMHVPETTSLCLKSSLENLFNKLNLSVSRLRGQGYDGASNMQGEFNGLKALILKENASAFYIHCFAHQLQLALVHVAKDLSQISFFFFTVNNLVNTVGASCKRRDKLRDKEEERISKQLESGEISSGHGMNQETSLKRAGDTRWGSHYGTLINLIIMFSSVIDVLVDVEQDASNSDQKGLALHLLTFMQSFEFIFILHLMRDVLAITNDLSKALQRKDQDIVNAMNLVKISKERLQKMRSTGWDSLFVEVSLFCTKHNVIIPAMPDDFVVQGRPRRKTEVITNLRHYQADLFYLVIDKQQIELNNRFDEVSSELLICMASLNPTNSFVAFNNEKLIRLSEFYSDDFSEQERMVLCNQLETYEVNMKSDNNFSNLGGISDLAKRMVDTRTHIVYDLVYRLIKLALILPVATATVERVFSAMNIVKNRLRNRMGDEWMNDCLITYIENDVFDGITNDAIMERFQQMKTRRGQL